MKSCQIVGSRGGGVYMVSILEIDLEWPYMIRHTSCMTLKKWVRLACIHIKESKVLVLTRNLIIIFTSSDDVFKTLMHELFSYKRKTRSMFISLSV